MNRPSGGATTSEDIMARLIANAKKSERGQRTIETLTRLKIACDDIASGRAVSIARKAAEDSGPFEVKPPRINSRIVGEYIKIMRRIEGEAKWPGPHQSTLRADENFKLYLDARQTEARGSREGRRPGGTRARSINGIVAKISDAAERLTMMQTIEKGREAQRQLQVLQTAIPKLWAVDIDAIIDGNVTPADNGSDLTVADRLAVRSLVAKLTDNRELREFGLFCEDDRVKAMAGTGASLISKTELALLRRLAKIDYRT